MNYTSTTCNQPGKDPRCPHCGKPVIRDGVLGQEGTYHQQCVEPGTKAAGPYAGQVWIKSGGGYRCPNCWFIDPYRTQGE